MSQSQLAAAGTASGRFYFAGRSLLCCFYELVIAYAGAKRSPATVSRGVLADLDLCNLRGAFCCRCMSTSGEDVGFQYAQYPDLKGKRLLVTGRHGRS